MKKKRNEEEYLNEASGNESKENLGLDADGSTEGSSESGNLDSDNDRISGNPDGEDDQNNTSEAPGHSSLMDK